MRIRLVIPVLTLLLAACASNPINPAGLCTHAARVGGVDYALAGPASPERVGAEFTRTQRQRGCEDVIEFGKPAPEAWRDGDSSFPANTPLHASLDHPTSEVLLVQWPDGRWTELRRLPHN